MITSEALVVLFWWGSKTDISVLQQKSALLAASPSHTTQTEWGPYVLNEYPAHLDYNNSAWMPTLQWPLNLGLSFRRFCTMHTVNLLVSCVISIVAAVFIVVVIAVWGLLGSITFLKFWIKCYVKRLQLLYSQMNASPQDLLFNCYSFGRIKLWRGIQKTMEVWIIFVYLVTSSGIRISCFTTSNNIFSLPARFNIESSIILIVFLLKRTSSDFVFIC